MSQSTYAFAPTSYVSRRTLNVLSCGFRPRGPRGYEGHALLRDVAPGVAKCLAPTAPVGLGLAAGLGTHGGVVAHGRGPLPGRRGVQRVDPPPGHAGSVPGRPGRGAGTRWWCPLRCRRRGRRVCEPRGGSDHGGGGDHGWGSRACRFVTHWRFPPRGRCAAQRLGPPGRDVRPLLPGGLARGAAAREIGPRRGWRRRGAHRLDQIGNPAFHTETCWEGPSAGSFGDRRVTRSLHIELKLAHVPFRATSRLFEPGLAEDPVQPSHVHGRIAMAPVIGHELLAQGEGDEAPPRPAVYAADELRDVAVPVRRGPRHKLADVHNLVRLVRARASPDPDRDRRDRLDCFGSLPGREREHVLGAACGYSATHHAQHALRAPRDVRGLEIGCIGHPRADGLLCLVRPDLAHGEDPSAGRLLGAGPATEGRAPRGHVLQRDAEACVVILELAVRGDCDGASLGPGTDAA
mmetsp:Transcript_20711/g.58091  ORF Transcript_20711/g.58091 Transcript_20711/m.58091 type:complete len:462 (+) Transcript_20711:72-1457(+)